MVTGIRNIKAHRGGQSGFTLIELMIVVVIIGIIATLIIPMFLDALQKGKQKRTMAEVRLVGTCWMSWLTDQVSSSAGALTRTFDVGGLTEVDASTVLASLFQSQTFFYCSEVPTVDAWGFAYEYRVNTATLSASQVISIRARARDGAWDSGGTVYNLGPYITTNYDRDIVWADGLFVSYPQGATVVNALRGEI
jgi:general secretion pathway protein G